MDWFSSRHVRVNTCSGNLEKKQPVNWNTIQSTQSLITNCTILPKALNNKATVWYTSSPNRTWLILFESHHQNVMLFFLFSGEIHPFYELSIVVPWKTQEATWFRNFPDCIRSYTKTGARLPSTVVPVIIFVHVGANKSSLRMMWNIRGVSICNDDDFITWMVFVWRYVVADVFGSIAGTNYTVKTESLRDYNAHIN